MNSKAITEPLYRQYLPLILIACMAVSYLAQNRYDFWRFHSQPKAATTYNEYIEPEPLPGNSAKAASFGATEFTADIYWLQLIQYYGGGEPYGKYRRLPDLYNTITDLSPQFLSAYQNGLLVLPGEGFVDQAIALGEKGQKNLPGKWEIPYYEGLVYHIYKKDYVKAGALFQKAADDPGAPAITKLFAGIYYNKADDRQTAYNIFQTVYETSKDSFVKERAKKYVDHLSGLFALQDAVTKFKQTFGRNPHDLDELVKEKILSSLPVSPLGVIYSYDQNTGTVSDGK